MKRFRNVLLVDDDMVCNFMHKRILEKMKFSENIMVANNGREALKKLEDFTSSNKDDLIILDLNMPIMNGFEFLEEFQKLGFRQNIKIIVLTSSSAIQDLDRLKSYPVMLVLTKPLMVETIPELLSQIA